MVPLPAMPVELIAATADPDLVDVPARLALAIDGEGSPNSPAFGAAVGALYGVAYALRFGRSHSHGNAFSIGVLEARWSAIGDGPGVPPPDEWRWRLRITVPSDVRDAELEQTKADALARATGKLAGSRIVPQVFLEHIPRQRLGRVLHVGPYADEGATLARLDLMLVTAGEKPARSHVEVYLSDPRRTSPARLRTVLLRELA